MPDLIYPYVKDAEVLWEKHQELEKRRDDPGLEDKLRAARQKYWAEKKSREGK